jgi:hypothetical protein
MTDAFEREAALAAFSSATAVDFLTFIDRTAVRGSGRGGMLGFFI